MNGKGKGGVAKKGVAMASGKVISKKKTPSYGAFAAEKSGGKATVPASAVKKPGTRVALKQSKPMYGMQAASAYVKSKKTK